MTDITRDEILSIIRIYKAHFGQGTDYRLYYNPVLNAVFVEAVAGEEGVIAVASKAIEPDAMLIIDHPVAELEDE